MNHGSLAFQNFLFCVSAELFSSDWTQIRLERYRRKLSWRVDNWLFCHHGELLWSLSAVQGLNFHWEENKYIQGAEVGRSTARMLFDWCRKVPRRSVLTTWKPEAIDELWGRESASGGKQYSSATSAHICIYVSYMSYVCIYLQSEQVYNMDLITLLSSVCHNPLHFGA